MHTEEKDGLPSQAESTSRSNLAPQQKKGNDKVAELKQQLRHQGQANAGRHHQLEDQISFSDAPKLKSQTSIHVYTMISHVLNIYVKC